MALWAKPLASLGKVGQDLLGQELFAEMGEGGVLRVSGTAITMGGGRVHRVSGTAITMGEGGVHRVSGTAITMGEGGVSVQPSPWGGGVYGVVK